MNHRNTSRMFHSLKNNLKNNITISGDFYFLNFLFLFGHIDRSIAIKLKDEINILDRWLSYIFT